MRITPKITIRLGNIHYLLYTTFYLIGAYAMEMDYNESVSLPLVHENKNIIDLPNEILDEIFHFCDHKTLSNMAITNCFFYDLVYFGNIFWNHMFEYNELDINSNVLKDLTIYLKKAQLFNKRINISLLNINIGHLNEIKHFFDVVNECNILFLSDLEIKPLRSFLNSHSLSNLKILKLSGNNLGNKITKIMLNCKNLKSITNLDLSWNFIHNKGLFYLTLMPIHKLKILNLKWNKIGNKGITCFAKSKKMQHLTSLNLSWNFFSAQGAIALANSAFLSNLKVLDLAWNNICEKGAIAIASSGNFTNLTDLNLQGNMIEDEGLKAIIDSENLRNLRILNLNLNRITHIYHLDIIRWLKPKIFFKLFLSDNDIILEQREILQKTLKDKIYFSFNY